MHRNHILTYAQLSKLVYEKAENKDSDAKIGFKLPPWSEISIPGVSLKDKEEPKLKAKVFQKDKEIVIAFKGTTISDKSDLKNNLQILLSKKPPRVDEAKNYVDQVLEYFRKKRGTLFCCKSFRVVITGHSLGGAIAEWISMQMGLEAYTFDSPGCLSSEMETQPSYKKRCHNFLSDPNLINTYHYHFGQVYFINIAKENTYWDFLLQGVADSAQSLSESSTEFSSEFESSSDFFKQEPVKRSTQYAIQKTIEHLSGKTLINHTLLIHGIDYMIKCLNKEYVKIQPVHRWPEFKEMLIKIGARETELKECLTSPEKLISLIDQTTCHVPKLDEELRALIILKPELQTGISDQKHCIIL